MFYAQKSIVNGYVQLGSSTKSENWNQPPVSALRFKRLFRVWRFSFILSVHQTFFLLQNTKKLTFNDLLPAYTGNYLLATATASGGLPLKFLFKHFGGSAESGRFHLVSLNGPSSTQSPGLGLLPPMPLAPSCHRLGNSVCQGLADTILQSQYATVNLTVIVINQKQQTKKQQQLGSSDKWIKMWGVYEAGVRTSSFLLVRSFAAFSFFHKDSRRK